MTGRYVFPIRISRYEAEVSEKLEEFGDKISVDAFMEKHKDNPAALKEFNQRGELAERRSIKPVEEKAYLDSFERFMKAGSEDVEAADIFVSSGYVVLTRKEAEKMGLVESGRGVSI